MKGNLKILFLFFQGFKVMYEVHPVKERVGRVEGWERQTKLTNRRLSPPSSVDERGGSLLELGHYQITLHHDDTALRYRVLPQDNSCTRNIFKYHGFGLLIGIRGVQTITNALLHSNDE